MAQQVPSDSQAREQLTLGHQAVCLECSQGKKKKKKKNAHRNTFLNAKKQKQDKYPTVIQQITEPCCISLMEYTAIKTKGSFIAAGDMEKCHK